MIAALSIYTVTLGMLSDYFKVCFALEFALLIGGRRNFQIWKLHIHFSHFFNVAVKYNICIYYSYQYLTGKDFLNTQLRILNRAQYKGFQ